LWLTLEAEFVELGLVLSSSDGGTIVGDRSENLGVSGGPSNATSGDIVVSQSLPYNIAWNHKPLTLPLLSAFTDNEEDVRGSPGQREWRLQEIKVPTVRRANPDGASEKDQPDGASGRKTPTERRAKEWGRQLKILKINPTVRRAEKPRRSVGLKILKINPTVCRANPDGASEWQKAKAPTVPPKGVASSAKEDPGGSSGRKTPTERRARKQECRVGGGRTSYRCDHRSVLENAD
jgi:hypothetical protein